MGDNDYDPVGGHTKEEADAAYEALFRELHGSGSAEDLLGRVDESIGQAGDPLGRNQEGAGPAWDPQAIRNPDSDVAPREKVAVVGHVYPDTDCVCAAIAYARMRNMIDPAREYIPFRAGPLNAETEYVLKRFGASVPEMFPGAAEGGFETILVDHNKKSRIPDGVDMKYDVIEIIDHHRLRGAETAVPIRVRCEPYGATGTILYEMYLEKGLAPDAQTAGMLCAGIISDTYLLRTYKTVREDRIACAALANIAGVDIEELADEMFSVW
ncbi:MAG: DHH family phosphoesterase [Clostridiales bacterium]|nr:DHH family phosphoesterase [Clostridiales bacterium]